MFLVDGYNLLHVLKAGRHAPVDHFARLRMLDQLTEFARRKSAKVICFLDGLAGELLPGELDRVGVRVKFCGPAKGSADAAICNYVEEAQQPHRLTVISNDREVRNICRREGAKIITSDDFASDLREIAPPAKEPAAKTLVSRRELENIEQKMLEEIGDIAEFERRVLEDE